MTNFMIKLNGENEIKYWEDFITKLENYLHLKNREPGMVKFADEISKEEESFKIGCMIEDIIFYILITNTDKTNFKLVDISIEPGWKSLSGYKKYIDFIKEWITAIFNCDIWDVADIR